MNQIEELQSRITAALERISSGVETAQARVGAATQADLDLNQALEDEKLANAQLEERLRALKQKHADEIAALSDAAGDSDELDKLRAELDARKAEIAELTAAAGDSEELDALRAELDARKAEIAELSAAAGRSEELDALNVELAAQKAETDKQADMIATLDLDMQRLRQANDQLRDSNAALRAANEEGVGEPHLINKAMLAELEALRAARAADVAHASAVISKLGPLLADAANLAEGEDD